MAESKKKAAPSHPSCIDMIVAALTNLKDKKGSSAHSIKKYIATNYIVDMERLAPHIKKAFATGVANGKLLQIKGKGASGSFKLNAADVDAKAKKVKEAAKKKALKEKEVAKKKALKEKAAAKLQKEKASAKKKTVTKKSTKAKPKDADKKKKKTPKKSDKPKKATKKTPMKKTKATVKKTTDKKKKTPKKSTKKNK